MSRVALAISFDGYKKGGCTVNKRVHYNKRFSSKTYSTGLPETTPFAQPLLTSHVPFLQRLLSSSSCVAAAVPAPPSNLLQSPSPLPHRRCNSSLPSQLVESSHCHSSAARLLRSLPRLRAACGSSSAPPLSPTSSSLLPASKPRTRRPTPVPPLNRNRASSAPLLVPKRATSTRFSLHSIATKWKNLPDTLKSHTASIIHNASSSCSAVRDLLRLELCGLRFIMPRASPSPIHRASSSAVSWSREFCHRRVSVSSIAAFVWPASRPTRRPLLRPLLFCRPLLQPSPS
ncbi:uncharacterized protein [Arachis hypogaea]|uniref:uncharacterized protein isoform X1 n=1 Tax=Arachis hypogaea TaxID=3818 RepID=UPI000DED4F7E|nr:flocculation protein FLO11 isoform X2 [Arachis hypogaea]